MSSTYCEHGRLRIPVPGKEHRPCIGCRDLLLVPPSAELKRGNPPSRLAARRNALARISMERDRQMKLWGNGPLPLDRRLAVLTEEVGEVAKAMQDETDKELLAELSQVAAVALRWMEDLLLEMDR